MIVWAAGEGRQAYSRQGLRALLLASNHVADDVAALVMDELCGNVGLKVRAHAEQLQEDMAMRLGATLVEEEEFIRKHTWRLVHDQACSCTIARILLP
eukprot:48326-Pelagomonas_calceolata.AAC.2